MILYKMLTSLAQPKFLNSKALELVFGKLAFSNGSRRKDSEKKRFINLAECKLLNSKALKLRYFNKKFEESP